MDNLDSDVLPGLSYAEKNPWCSALCPKTQFVSFWHKIILHVYGSTLLDIPYNKYKAITTSIKYIIS